MSPQSQSPQTLDSLHHVALQVSDVGRAVAWYQARFKCEVAWRDETWALLRFANTSLALVVPGQHPPHVALSVEGAERYGELTPHRDGTRSVYVKDSEGNVVELMDPESL
jgi:catechol 2,3-dioxygenase-like lactoylglutathione lyase family enzyme